MTEEQAPKKKQGFATMSPERRREIAAMGGRNVPPEKRSFSQSPELAARAGSVGGKSVDPAKRSFSRSPELAAEAGRKGGVAAKRPKYD